MNFLLAFFAGALYTLGFEPYALWPITIFSICLLFHTIHASPSRSLSLLLCFALGKNSFGITWIYHSVATFGNAEPFLASVIVGLLVLVLSAFYLPGGLLLKFLGRRQQIGFLLLLFASVLTLTEWLLTWLLSGFPWLFVGHAVVDTNLSTLLPIIGSLGVGWLVYLIAGALYVGFSRRKGFFILLAVTPWLMAFLLSFVVWGKEQQEVRVALVQANLKQDRKWLMEERSRNLEKHLALSDENWGYDLIVWPEAAITLFGIEAQRALELLDQKALQANTNFISGIPTLDPVDGTNKNSLVAIGQGKGIYSKQHLVPFGEYVPFESVLRGLIGFFDLPMSRMSAGSPGQDSLTLAINGANFDVSPAICYEIAYGESLRKRSINSSAIITVSNDTWFGPTNGPWQHLQIARVRALENAKPVIRATNNGVTAVIDKNGRVVDKLPQFTSDVLRSTVNLTQGRTPYSYLGDWPILFIIFLVFLYAWSRLRTL